MKYTSQLVLIFGYLHTNLCSTDVARVETNCLEGVDCRLEARELWDKFHRIGMEMIITKVGR